MPYLLIDNANTIQNVILWDGVTPYTPPAGLQPVLYTGESPCAAGYTWNGSSPVPPSVAPPSLESQASATPQIPGWKIQEILESTPSPVNAGKTLLDDATAAIANMSKGAQIAWAGGANIQYTSPTLAAVRNALGITADNFNSMWIAAAAVEL